jgi:hypothetical protein
LKSLRHRARTPAFSGASSPGVLTELLQEGYMAVTHRSKWIFGITISILFLLPVLAKAQVAWVKDFDAALKQASKEKKFIVLDISASW